MRLRGLSVALVALLVACRAEAVPGAATPLRYVERVVGARSATIALPLIIALHGRGDRPEHFITLFERLPGAARVIAPAAPLPQGDGYSWFSVRVREGKPEVLDPEVDQAATQVAALIAEILRTRPTRGRPIVTGFSQGGILSFTLASRHPEVVGLAIPIGGWLPPSLLPADGRGVPPILALHGAQDRVVPYGATRVAVDALRARGVKIDLVTDPEAGHVITPLMAGAFYRALGAHL